MENNKKLNVGDNILVNNELDTFVTKIKGNIIYFLNNGNLEFALRKDIEYLGSPIMKENINQYFKVDTGIYPFPIHVFIGDKKFVLKTMKDFLIKRSYVELKYKLNNDADNHSAEFLKGDDNSMIIHVKEKIDSIEQLTILNHEILHACICIHRVINSKLTFESEESYTYLYEYLCKQIYQQLEIFKSLKLK